MARLFPYPPIKSVLAATAVAVFLTAPVTAADAPGESDLPKNDQRAFEIAARSDRSDLGFGDSVAEMTMILRNAAGQESERTLRLSTLEKESEEVGDKSLIVFDSPKDVEGTALLSHAQILESDDQWLYLPALKRVKRISSANKSGPFVGSEFAFEDFTSQELGKFSYTYEGEDKIDGLGHDIVVRTPLYEKSGYTRQVAWIDQEVFQTRKVVYYDRKGDLLKTLILDDYREYEGGVWRPHLMKMTNHQTNKSTDLIYSNYNFKSGLTERDFVKGVLERIR